MGDSPSSESLQKLTESIRDAYLEECANDECRCITTEEHKENLRRRDSLRSGS